MKRDDKAPDYLTIEIKHMDKSWGILQAMPREFSTGSVGYFGVGKIFNPENPKARYQLGLNIALIGSKKRIEAAASLLAFACRIGNENRPRQKKLRRHKMDYVKEMPIRIDRVMELTGYSRSYIHKLVCWKKLPCHKPTNGRLFFLESEIIEFLNQGKRSADYELSKIADAMLNGEAVFKKIRR